MNRLRLGRAFRREGEIMTLKPIDIQILIPKSVEISRNQQLRDNSINNDKGVFINQIQQQQEISKSRVLLPNKPEKGKIDRDKEKDKNNRNKDKNNINKEKSIKRGQKNNNKLGNFIDLRL
ncbi:MAG: hypothetical protein HPY70_03405 [Firmicutes bacterium]|jgi:hypothetical protein|nr:hypothetical protein [Bacillota bacterium]